MSIRSLLPMCVCCLLLAAPEAQAAASAPSLVQFQAWLHKDVDAGRPWMVVPFTGNAQNKAMAHSILDALWAEPAYRENLEGWLATHHDGIAEDMLDSWYRHYHDAFASSFEFLDEGTQKALWRLDGFNPIYAMDRRACQTDSQEKIEAFIRTARETAQDKNAKAIVDDIPKALAREFARENHPQPGDRPIPEVMGAIAVSTLHAVAKTWPVDDERRIIDHYSYHRAKQSQPSLQEMCERYWVVSHAIEDASLKSPTEQISALLMRSAITSTAYSTRFKSLDARIGLMRPTRVDFKPGKASIYVPRILVSANVTGDVEYKLDIDETGKVTNSTIKSGAVVPGTVKSIDGSDVASNALLLAIVDAYYRDGAFTPKVVDGKPVPFSITIPFGWRGR